MANNTINGMVAINTANTTINKEDTTMMNQAMEMTARKFAEMVEQEFSTEEVAGTIVDWAIGYRCEAENVPVDVLEWCKGIDTERISAINRALAVAEINKFYDMEYDEDDETIVESGLNLATMDWSDGALEWLARTWSQLESDTDIDTVARMITEWQFGYRCEQESQPSVLLVWAATKDIGLEMRDRVRDEVNARIDEIVQLVADGEYDWAGIAERNSEYELTMAHQKYESR